MLEYSWFAYVLRSGARETDRVTAADHNLIGPIALPIQICVFTPEGNLAGSLAPVRRAPTRSQLFHSWDFGVSSRLSGLIPQNSQEAQLITNSNVFLLRGLPVSSVILD